MDAAMGGQVEAMSGLTGMVTTVGMHVPADVPVCLRGSVESSIFLVIGRDCEITLAPEHVRALPEQCASALRDMELIGEAELVVDRVIDAGAAARTAAERALKHARLAQEAGAQEQAAEARAAAMHATAAADSAQQLLELASEAMLEADQAAEAAEAAGSAALAAARTARPAGLG